MLHNVDCRIGLNQMIADQQQVDCVITSPPYWNLRDYGLDGSIWDDDPNCDHLWNDFNSFNLAKEPVFCVHCGAWFGALGLEPNFELFIKHLCDIYDLIWQVLKPTGTCWVNLGDSYGSNKNYIKCLLMIPDRFVIEMIDNHGWTLRNKIVWHKPNAMPSSAKDRFTVDFEYIYFFVKRKKYNFSLQRIPHKEPERSTGEKENRGNKYDNPEEGVLGNKMFSKGTREYHPDGKPMRTVWSVPEKYYFEQLKEPIAQTKANLSRRKHKPGKVDSGKYSKKNKTDNTKPLAFNEYWSLDKNKRAVWSINTKANKEFHFATFPPKLVQPMIKAGSPRYVCGGCGKLAIKEYKIIKELEPGRKSIGLGPKTIQGGDGLHHHTYRKFIGYSKCKCGGKSKRGIVLDPFAGTGITLLEAWKLGRDYIGFEASEEYCEMAERNLSKTRYKRITDF